MIKEIDIGGVYITPFLAWAILAVLTNTVLRRLLNRIGFYRLVWHRYLFDTAVFLLLFFWITLFILQRERNKKFFWGVLRPVVTLGFFTPPAAPGWCFWGFFFG